MGYKNEQFFNNGQGEIGTRVNVKPINPAFNYPDRTLRTSEYRNGKWEPRTYELQRGYIRTLQDYARTGATDARNLPIAKCNFQFNPEYINQEVQMRVGLMNFFLQSPAQMAQPVGGEVNFAFELRFDRSYTLNNEVDEFDSENLGTAKEKNIGVLADLRAFYEVIGQGVSKDFLEFQKSVARSRAEVELQLGADYVEENDTRLPNYNDNLNNFFDNNVNFGNSAFLLPVPVRVVFSSLFMVDGFVTATSVSYTQFSKSLIPMSCVVGVQMTAMYIGFAKDKTYLQMSLDQAEENDRRQIRENINDAKSASKIIEDNIKKLEVRAYSKATGFLFYNGVGNGTSDVDVKAIDGYLVPNNRFTNEFIKRTTPRGVSGNATNVRQFFEVDIQESTPYAPVPGVLPSGIPTQRDQIEEIFKNHSVSINMQIVLQMYGPFSSAEANSFVSMIKLIDRGSTLTASGQVAYQRYQSKLISETRLADPSINSYEEWENYRTGKKDKNIANKTMISNQFSNESLKQLESSANKYFVAAISASVTPTVSGYQTGVLQFQRNAQSIAVDGDNTSISMSLDFKRKATDA